MRRWFVRLHRILGLVLAAFLFISGLTGAVISWDHEIDEWLNPELFEAKSGRGQARSVYDLADEIERRDPRVIVSYVPLELEPGHTALFSVAPRLDPSTGKAFELDFNQVALDPVTAEEQGRRKWGEPSLTRQNFMPFLYKLHYSMHIPDASGVEIGVVFMGVLAIAWVLDSFIALVISFPTLGAWRNSFRFRLREGKTKLNFDLHRSGGVWTWALLVVLAITAVSMNLGLQVVRPVVALFSPLTPSPFEIRPMSPTPIAPALARARAVELGVRYARERDISAPPGGVFYSPEFGGYGVGFFEPGFEHGDGGLGNPWLYLDGKSGEFVAADIPGRGSAGDLFMQLQFPLHSGRIIGVPGRIFVSLLGLLVAVLSVTGVLIWARRKNFSRRARLPAVQPGSIESRAQA
jgi:uncharacterized iron-regulated membrane protein